MTRRLLISFSGGETSAYLCWLILTHMRQEYDEIIIVFANTGFENEETLIFVNQVDEWLQALFGIAVTWVEAIIHHGQRASPTARVVTFQTASRNGEPFEEAIKKYGIPNQKYNNCTRSLKLNPIRAYARSIGWPNKSYDTAIGIRADEIDRMSAEAATWRLIYPLVKRFPRTKPQINFWWSIRNWRLKLEGWKGNCKTCWKKSFRKLFTVLDDDPGAFDFFDRMERENGHIGPEFEKPETKSGYRRTFFRGNKSVADLMEERSALGDRFTPADNDAAVYDERLDTGGGCGDSCEVFSDEMLGQADPDWEDAA
jgi:hypothetical protein